MLRYAGNRSLMQGERRVSSARRSRIAGSPRATGLSCLRAALLLGLTLLPGAPLAQTAGGGGDEAPEPAISGSVLIINMERVLREADAARSIQRQAEEIREAIQEQLSGQQDALRQEEQELVALRQTLPPTEFSSRVDNFEKRVRQLKRVSNERGSRLQKALFEANEELKKRLRPELIAIMQERNAAVMIDERNVVISARVLDVTGEAIERLNASTPKIAIVWSEENRATEGAGGQTDAGDGSTERSQSGDTSREKPQTE